MWRGLSWRKRLLIMEWIASLFLFLSLSFSPKIAVATSFGPISLVDQARSAQYIVRARVLTPGNSSLERTSRRPYTYWKIAVLEQPLGNELGGEVDIRQPGGEVGDLGYRVAGSANFQAGEEVFVSLRDTDDGDVKEVVGLASGKYTVEDGGKAVHSGLGPAILGPDGNPLTADEFTQVVRRIASGRETQKDKTIFVNRMSLQDGHNHGQNPHAHGISSPASSPVNAVDQNQANTFKPSPAEPEKLSTGTSGFWWILTFALAAAAIVALMVIGRR